MKKVCHITTVHSPLDDRIFYKECITLHEAGFEVVLIAQNDKDGSIDGIQIKALPEVKNRLTRVLRLPWLALKTALKENADLYQFHDPELILTGLLLKMRGKKVIYDVHEDAPRDVLSKPYLSPYFAGVLSHLLEWVEDFSAKRFDGIAAATPHIASRFSAFSEHVAVVANYPLLAEMYVPEPWESRRNCVAYVGGISRIRGIKELVTALEFVDTTLLLAGSFESDELQAEVTALRGWEKVIYYGQVDRKEVSSILGQAKVGIVTCLPVPNHINSLPVKMFEYMSAGIPVIASDFPLWREIVEGNKCGMCVDPLNPKELAEAMEYLLKHPEEAKTLGENGRKAVEEKFNWDKAAVSLLKLYEEVMS